MYAELVPVIPLSQSVALHLGFDRVQVLNLFLDALSHKYSSLNSWKSSLNSHHSRFYNSSISAETELLLGVTPYLIILSLTFFCDQFISSAPWIVLYGLAQLLLEFLFTSLYGKMKFFFRLSIHFF